MIAGIGAHTAAFIIKNRVGISHILHVDASVGRRDIPASFDQAEGKPAALTWLADVSTGSDRADSVSHHVMAGDVSPSGDRHVSRLRTKRACPRIVQSVIIIVL